MNSSIQSNTKRLKKNSTVKSIQAQKGKSKKKIVKKLINQTSEIQSD
jgi:hypothetical protein